jgi:class 3 adenylate cyclase
MGFKSDLKEMVSEYLEGDYKTYKPEGVPKPEDIPLGNEAAKIEATALFIDIRQSSNITNTFRRQTAAKMVKGYFDGSVRIIRVHNGEVRSFNGDGMLGLFVGGSRSTNAVKAAMQIDWFVGNVLKPEIARYFEDNQGASDQGLEFNVGCGLDDGHIFAVRVGIRGTNDVAWVGRCTNTAAKVASDVSRARNIAITRAVYERINKSHKYDTSGKHIWSEEEFQEYGGVTRAIRTTTYWDSIS